MGQRPPSEEEALASLAEQTRIGRTHPVLFGSALGAVGIRHVINAVAVYLPAADGDSENALHASVFKIVRSPAGHKSAYVRLHDGSLMAGDHIVVHHRARHPAEQAALFRALQQMSEQDPLIDARLDGVDREFTV